MLVKVIFFFFYNKECLYKCASCSNGFSCDTCIENRINKECICPPGYLDLMNPKCDKCSYECATCNYDHKFCETCSDVNRINPPFCYCQDGFIDDGV